MQFEYEGAVYRIAFQHPVPVNLAYHAQHVVELARVGRSIRLMCAECHVRIGRPVQLLPAVERNVRCTIYRGTVRENSKPEWKPIFVGDAKLNRKAKDQYTREGGRVAALERALTRGSANFRVKALTAYRNRKGMVGQAGVVD